MSALGDFAQSETIVNRLQQCIPSDTGSWVEERIRVNDSCAQVVRKNLNNVSFVYLDGKGDADLVAKFFTLSEGRKPYGSWCQRLNKKDRPPRGKCQKVFNTWER